MESPLCFQKLGSSMCERKKMVLHVSTGGHWPTLDLKKELEEGWLLVLQYCDQSEQTQLGLSSPHKKANCFLLLVKQKKCWEKYING